MACKKIKAGLSLALCALLLVLTCFTAYAETTTYTVSEIDDMEIKLPNGITAVTRSSKSTDKYFSVFGLDYNTTMKNFQDGDIYLQGMDKNGELTVTVMMFENEESKGLGNYSLLAPDKLAEVQANFLVQSEYNSCKSLASNDIVWLEGDVNIKNNNKYVKAYKANTVYDKMSVDILVQRNGGNATESDYGVFKNIVTNTKFLKQASLNSIVPYLIVGASIVVILVAVVVVILVRRAKKRRKKRKNNKIIEELAGKYKTKKSNAQPEPETYIDLGEKTDISSEQSAGDDYYFDKTEINSDDIMKPIEEDVKVYKPAKKSVSENEIDEILEYKRASDAQKDKPLDETYIEVVYSKDEPEGLKLVKPKSEEIVRELEEEQPEAEERPLGLEERLFGSDDEEAVEDYSDDEELVRQQAKKMKFHDSDDFFDEAPKKTVGVISSKEIREAEDFDVINEVEKRVSEVEKPKASAGEAFINGLKGFGAGVKSFFVHCGYFCTNVSRMIKRKKAAKKRAKAEAQRRERERMRAERARARRAEMQQNGGLVQVHSRSEHRAAQRRPSGSHTVNPDGRRDR